MRAVVVIPAYRARPGVLEAAFVRQSLRQLAGHPGAWVLPQSLDARPYQDLAPQLSVERFADEFFRGIAGYNRLMLSPAFYDRWVGFDSVLICQTDALVLRDNLDEFLLDPSDYIGAPLRADNELPRFYFPGAGRLMRAAPWLVPSVRPLVGNGGLSLRRVEAFRSLLRRERVRVRLWRLYEDLYFSCRACDSQSGLVAATAAGARRFCAGTSAGDWVLDAEQRPFGLHKPQAYAPRALEQLLRQSGEGEAADMLCKAGAARAAELV